MFFLLYFLEHPGQHARLAQFPHIHTSNISTYTHVLIRSSSRFDDSLAPSPKCLLHEPTHADATDMFSFFIAAYSRIAYHTYAHIL